jgi:hypothetical protein
MNIDKIIHKINLLHSANAETPTSVDLINLILSRLDIDWSDPSKTYIDPACGRGTFLLSLLKKLEEAGHSREHIINNMLYGYDLNPVQAMISKKALKMACDTKSNIYNENSLTKEWNMKFDMMVGNYPFNDDSVSAGRDVNKVKENTKSLDHEFYKKMIDVAKNHAVILRSNCLGKDSSVRQSIFTDLNVKELIDTTAHFKVAPDTMCVIRTENYTSNIKTILDRSEEEFQIETNADTKLSLSSGAKNIEVIKKIWQLSDISNLGQLWTRSPINRNDPKVNDSVGTPFVEITGDDGKEVIVKYFDGDISNIQHVNKWKVISNVNASRTSIGAIKIVPPGTITSNSVIYFAFDTEIEAINCLNYLKTSFVKWYTPLAKVSAGNSSEFFSKVPFVDFATPITDDVIKHNFTKDEQGLVWN